VVVAVGVVAMVVARHGGRRRGRRRGSGGERRGSGGWHRWPSLWWPASWLWWWLVVAVGVVVSIVVVSSCVLCLNRRSSFIHARLPNGKMKGRMVSSNWQFTRRVEA
jgi:ABC-type Fe3+ transport system permease subunit